MKSEHWLISAAKNLLARSDAVPMPEVSLSGDIVSHWSEVCRVSKLDASQLADAVAEYFTLERANLDQVDPDFARQIPEAIARDRQVLAIDADGHTAWIATCDPADLSILEDLAVALRMPVVARVASPAEIEAKQAEVYEQESKQRDWGSIPKSLLAAELVLKRNDGTPVEIAGSSTAKLFVEVMRSAAHLKASDTHIQPYGEGAIVRNRIDGVLYRAVQLPLSVHQHLIRHVKVISGMDPTKKFIPQDGELRMELEKRQIDLRLSVVPVESSERLVIRLLPQDQVKTISMLHLPQRQQERLRKISQSSAGIILMTGPTGSGKTSLLYAMLAEMNSPDINIMTVEEPVEYRLRGSSQISVDTKTGLTFASALRSILRQDPDVVMVGEIRDQETAAIATQAAMTGHVVLSTVHTLDALLSVVRLEDLGVSSTTLADSLKAVVSQRLIRALCEECKKPLTADQLSQDEKQFAELWEAPKYSAVGCDACRQTGYLGRVPVAEIIEVTGELQARLRSRERDLAQLEILAAKSGTRFLAEGFADRITEGTTTVSEVLRAYGRSLFSQLRHFSNLRKMVES